MIATRTCDQPLRLPDPARLRYGRVGVVCPLRHGAGRHCRPWRCHEEALELLLCFLHPLAVVLMWINLASRSDLSTGTKLAWAIFGLIPLVPFIYVLTGGDLF